MFRSIGNQTILKGHFTRTLALAEMLKDVLFFIFAASKY